MKLDDDLINTFDRSYMECAESHATGDDDTSERCCIAAGLSEVLREFADLIDRGPAIPLPPSIYSALLRERGDTP